MWFKYGLKAQKLLAQGIALGIMAISKAPCKGKSFVYCQVFESFCPYRATGLRPGRMGLTFLPFYFSTISPPLGCISTFRFPFLSTFTVFICDTGQRAFLSLLAVS